MVEILSGLKHKIGDVSLHMTADATASLEHWKDALVHFMKHVGQMEDQFKLAQEQAKAKAEAQLEKSVTEAEAITKGS